MTVTIRLILNFYFLGEIMTQCKYFITKDDDSTLKTPICDKLVPKCNKILRWSTVNPAFNKIIKQCGTVWWLGICVMWHWQISLSSETAIATIGRIFRKWYLIFTWKHAILLGCAQNTIERWSTLCIEGPDMWLKICKMLVWLLWGDQICRKLDSDSTSDQQWHDLNLRTPTYW